MVRKAEVDYFDVAIVVEQEVLRLQVSMHDSILVDVLDPSQDLLHKMDSFLLVESLTLNYVVEEFASLRVLHYQVDVRFGLNYLRSFRRTS